VADVLDTPETIMPRTKKPPKPTHVRVAAFAHELEWTARRALVLRRALPAAAAIRWRRSGRDENGELITLVLEVQPARKPCRWYVATADLDQAAADVPIELVWQELSGLKPTPPDWLDVPFLTCADPPLSPELAEKLRLARITGKWTDSNLSRCVQPGTDADPQREV
jgi:hypothetical protein